NNLQKEDYDVMNKKIDLLTQGYLEAAEETGIDLQVNRAGSMVGVFFTDCQVTNFATAQTSDTECFAKYYRGMIHEGVFLPPSQFEGLFLSTKHTDDDIHHTIKAIQKVFKGLKG